MDRNDYYGAESASMSPLSKLYEHFGRTLDAPDKFGRGKDWNVDLVPKFIMANGEIIGAGVEKENKFLFLLMFPLLSVFLPLRIRIY